MKPGFDTSARGGFSPVLGLALVGMVVVAAVSGFLVGSTLIGEEPGQAGRSGTAQPMSDSTFAYIAFDPIYVNLAEGRLTRYLRLNLVLQAKQEAAPALQALLEDGKSAVLKNWLISYLSDMDLEDVKGRISLSRLRREIRDGFNELLEQLGCPQIETVLFVEFNIQ